MTLRSVVLALCSLVTVPLAAVAVTPAVVAAPAAATGPNVVIVLVDDMRLDDLTYLPYTRRLFRTHGTTFEHVISPHPVCCPARAGIATGQYAQSNGVHHNTGPWGGWQSMADNRALLPEWFRTAGYRTALVGKFLNGYKGGDIPGLTVNDTSVEDVYSAYGITSWNDGNPVVREGHQTDWMAQRTSELITQFGAEVPDRPFFLWTSYVAPHGMTVNDKWRPSVPPERFLAFRHDSHRSPASMRKPNYNERRIRDKPRAIRRLPPVPNRHIRRHHHGRVRSLYAVDAAVRTTVAALRESGEWDDTILVFTSDNGMGLGAHRVRSKNQPYQDVLRVPFLMTGPGVPAGHTDRRLGTLVDLPATLAALTGVEPGRVQDGTDLLTAPGNRAVLIQAGSVVNPFSWRGVYTRRYTWVRRLSSGETELYDRRRDPFELDNVAGDRSYRRIARQLHRLFRGQLEDCVGDSCLASAPR
jgi:arylsulfatase A-like enzyme